MFTVRREGKRVKLIIFFKLHYIKTYKEFKDELKQKEERYFLCSVIILKLLSKNVQVGKR